MNPSSQARPRMPVRFLRYFLSTQPEQVRSHSAIPGENNAEGNIHKALPQISATAVVLVLITVFAVPAVSQHGESSSFLALHYQALWAIKIEGLDGAVLPNGRFVTPQERKRLWVLPSRSEWR
jgi:hypothetical protein